MDDTILLKVGVEYEEVSTAMERTIIINPDSEQRLNYKFLEVVFANLAKSMKPGVKIGQVYQKVFAFVSKEKGEKFAKDHLPECFGFGIGYKTHEVLTEITKDSEIEIQANSTFYLNLYFKNLSYLKNNKKTYDFSIGETVFIKDKADILTYQSTSEYKDISYTLDDSDDDDEEEEGKDARQVDVDMVQKNIIIHERLRSKEEPKEARNDIKRKEHQDTLLNIKLANLRQRYDKGDINMEEKKVESKQMGELKAYKNQAKYPQNRLKPGKIFVDEKNKALLLPINQKQWLPVHISLVKSVSITGEGQWQFLRINFHVPGVNNLSGQNMTFPPLKGPNGVYLRELTFKSTD